MSWLLLDIEGTISPIHFVKQVLFPYASQALPEFVREHADDPQVQACLQQAAADMTLTVHAQPDPADIVAQLQQWIVADHKHTALKTLQGMIWERGYVDGAFRAPIYPDAVACMRQWRAHGGDIAIYSSGSVPAQQLLLRYSDAGDLNPLLSQYFDTKIGAKQERGSYQNITRELGVDAADIMFCSDVLAELDAAHQAGMRTVLVDRREDYPQARPIPPGSGHRRVESLDQLDDAAGRQCRQKSAD